jgi:rRNA maturation endonuclease Nob1
MKLRCYNCGYVFEVSGDKRNCAKCGSNALDMLVPRQRATGESSSSNGNLLLEVPTKKDNLMG